MIITREKGMRMWGGGSGSTSASGVNGGGGFSLAVTEGEGTGNAYTGFTYESGVLSLIKGEKFVTVDFFNRLFTAYDSDGNAILPNDVTSTINNLKLLVGTWTEEYLSALGKNSEGGGGGGGIELSDVWQSLKTNTDDYANQKINSAHIPDLSGTYATKTWVNQQGFVTSSGVTSVATGTGLTGGTITSTGTISINSTYQTYISNGNTAYGWGNHANAGYALASNSVSDVAYNTTGKKLTKTINGNTTDIVSASTLVTDGGGAKASTTITAGNGLTGGGDLSSNRTINVVSANAAITVNADNIKLNVINDYITTTNNTIIPLAAARGKDLNDRLAVLESWFEVDADGNVKTKDMPNGTHRGFYTESFVSALGSNSEGGGSGAGLEDVWDSLTNQQGTVITDNTKIAIAHIPDTSSTYGYLKSSALSGYATQAWVNQQGFLTTHQTLYTLSIYGGTTKVLDFKPNANASIYIKAGGDISLTNDTTNKYITLSYTHPTNGANTTISAASGKVLSAITVNSLGHVTSVSSKTLASADIPDISATYATASRATTLEGYFTNGVANSAAKLNTGTTTYTVWGQTYWQNGLPKSISNTYMSGVTNIDSLLYFDTTNSRVGVGTSSPSYKLDVSGEVRGTGFRTTTTNGSFGALNSRGSIFCNLDSSLSGGFSTGMYAIDSSGTTLGSAAGIFGDSNGIIRYYFGGTYNSPLMSILPSGNVGIGTTSPSYKLHVNGYTSTTRLYLSSSVYLEYDSSNSGVHLVGAGFYSDSYVSALGNNSSGGGGGAGLEEVWDSLTNSTGTVITTTTKIAADHIPNLFASKITSGTFAAARIPNLSWNKITSDKPTTLSGYGVLDDADGRYYALYGGTDLAPTSTNTINLNELRSTGSYYVSTNTSSQYVTNKPDDTQNYAFRVWVSAPGGTSGYRRQRFQYLTQMAIYERFYSTDTSTWGNWYLIQDNLANYALASSLNNYLSLSGGTMESAAIIRCHRVLTSISSGNAGMWAGSYYTGSLSESDIVITTVTPSSDKIALMAGYVGIGTYTPAYKLDVDGDVRADNFRGSLIGNATTSSSCTGNAATATTLATSRIIWGQNFNGSANVRGDLFLLSDADGTTVNTNSAKLKFNSYSADGTDVYRSPYIQGIGGQTYGRKRLGFFQSNATNYTDDFVEAMSILPTGNVGIGNTSPAYKLDVSGQGHFSHSTYDVLQLTRTGGAYSAGIAFNNSSDGLLGGLMVQGSDTSYSDIYNGIGTLRFKPVGGSSDFAVMHNGLTKFITATESGRYAELQNSGWLIHHITVNDAFSVAYCTQDSSGNNIGGICGCYGQNQTITNYFIGGTWNAPLVRIVRSNGNMGIGLGNTNPSYKLHVSGAIYGTGEITAASDERKKNIISNTKFNVKDIASARSIIYEWNDDRDKDNEKKTHGGSIAQDWIGKADSFLSQDGEGWYSINYGALALCSAITIAREVLKHEDRITLLEKENARLKARVAELEERRIA